MRAMQRQTAVLRLAPPAVGRDDRQLAAQIAPGERVRDRAAISSGVPSATTRRPRRPRPARGRRIQSASSIVSCVVLHHEHGVAHVAQLQQRVQQRAVVARVQADGRLVQDVEHAHQPTADLAGQPDALRLAAGERRRGPVQRQIVQAHVEHKLQAVADLLEHLVADLPTARRRTAW